MRFFLLITWLFAPALIAAPTPFRLDAGDFRVFEFAVNQTPVEVDSSFQVLRGDPSIHIELLPMSEFRQFNRGRQHDSLAVSEDGRSGAFRRIIDSRGQYAVVVVNKRKARPALVTLEVRTDLNPNADVISKTISPERRLTVILISFAIFFVTVTWAGVRLMRATKL